MKEARPNNQPKATGQDVQFWQSFVQGDEEALGLQKVVKALSMLTNRQKEIIYLKFYQNLSYDEVSDIMNISYQAARNLLHQAVKAMKKIMVQSCCLLINFV